jgi:hypothetical protein
MHRHLFFVATAAAIIFLRVAIIAVAVATPVANKRR